jgi:hypothetical protein
MPLFKSRTAEGVWLEMNCHRCFQVDEALRRLHNKDTQCPIQKRALESGRKPVKWDRNPRPKDMEHVYRCRAFQDKPASTARKRANEFDIQQGSLFEARAAPYQLVPVDGWPDRPSADEVDHA